MGQSKDGWAKLMCASGVAAIAALGGCVMEVGAPEQSLGTASEPLLGENSWEDCTEAEKARLVEGQRLGRIASRSGVFLECLARATHDGGVVRHLNGGDTFGPYVHCGGDIHPNMTANERVAHLATISASRMGVHHLCGIEVTGGSAQGGYDPEMIGWETVDSTPEAVALMIWHEVTHNYDYWHKSCSASTANEAPNIQGRCMQEVLAEAAEAPQCAAMGCAANELAFPVRYGEFGSEDPCECVPDVFSWPDNQNESGDRFGESLAVGDFNGDGYDDLAVGAPGEQWDTGAVYVFRGSDYGLRFWKRTSQWGISVVDYSESPPHYFTPGQSAGNEFGYALAAGDLNNDGYDELIIGAPGRSSDAGAIYVYGGTAAGLHFNNVQYIDQDANGGSVEAGDRFGEALAVGNFNGDSYVDLAAGAPGEVYGGDQSGVISVHRGRAGVIGVSAFLVNDGGFLHQEMGPWSNENGDEFGASLAAGDIDSDGLDEVIVGAPGENSNNGYIFRAEKVSGSWKVTDALTSSGTTRFGQVVAVGDIVGGSSRDIIVGAPSNLGGGGSVFIWRGASSAPVFTIQINGNETDRFGASLAIGHVTGSSKGDLVVGASRETFGSGPAEGRFLVYAGTSSNTFSSTVVGTRSQADFFDAGATDLALPPEHHGTDNFAHTVALGFFDGGSSRGFAVGAPTDQVDGVSSGAVFTYSPDWTAGRKIDQMTMRHGQAWPPY